MWLRIIIGSIAVVIGALMVIKNDWFLKNFGKNAWAEQHLGAEGGSRLLYKLLGLTIILIGFLTIFGLIEGIIVGIFSPLFPD